jgi:hypothetical protein
MALLALVDTTLYLEFRPPRPTAMCPYRLLSLSQSAHFVKQLVARIEHARLCSARCCLLFPKVEARGRGISPLSILLL